MNKPPIQDQWTTTDAIPLEEDNVEPVSGSIPTQILQLAEGFNYFHDAQGRAFVRLKMEDHDEIFPVNSASFRNFLAYQFF